MEQILCTYYANNARKLHNMVDKILLNFGGLSNKDMDDFYSLANEVFTDVIKKYDGGRSFDGFLYSCLSNKIKSEMTRRNRYKRRTDNMSVSIDASIGDDEDAVLSDLIVGDFDLEKEVFGGKEDYSRKMLLYLNKLSKLQKEVLKLTVSGYQANEIKEELNISEKQYSNCNEAIHSYRNVSVLF